MAQALPKLLTFEEWGFSAQPPKKVNFSNMSLS